MIKNSSSQNWNTCGIQRCTKKVNREDRNRHSKENKSSHWVCSVHRTAILIIDHHCFAIITSYCIHGSSFTATSSGHSLRDSISIIHRACRRWQNKLLDRRYEGLASLVFVWNLRERSKTPCKCQTCCQILANSDVLWVLRGLSSFHFWTFL